MVNFDFLSDDDSQTATNQHRTVVTIVTTCLSDHDKCNQEYCDSITGDYVVICKCSCHELKGEKWD